MRSIVTSVTEELSRRWVAGMADAYDRWLVPTVFAPFAADMARRVALLSPQRILEVAAGSGVVTRALVAALPDTAIVATDLNPAMVDVGASRVPEAEWRTADAMALPLADRDFDAVVCQFGVMFFPDRPAGLAELGRVCADGGRILFSVWDALERHEFEVALQAGLDLAFPDDPPTFFASVPHGCADLAGLIGDVEATGLLLEVAETVALEGSARSTAELAVGYCTGTPVRAEIEARGDLAATTDLVIRTMEQRLGSGPIVGRMSAHVIVARPPADRPTAERSA